jgi:5-methylcytosine-specific restriction endonuclease McrA
MLRACIVCGRPSERSRCPDHPYKRPDYGGRPWRRLRAQIIARDGGQCVRCGSQVSHLEVHHMDGRPSNNDPANLVTLCRSCHRFVQKGGRLSLRADSADTRPSPPRKRLL